jgi:hypothetical protein
VCAFFLIRLLASPLQERTSKSIQFSSKCPRARRRTTQTGPNVGEPARFVAKRYKPVVKRREKLFLRHRRPLQLWKQMQRAEVQRAQFLKMTRERHRRQILFSVLPVWHGGCFY